MALNIVAQMRDCSEADRWALVHAIRGYTLGVGPERVMVSRNALLACLADTGRVSKAVYEDWRAEQPYAAEWPSSRFIAATFDSWRRSMAAVGQAAVLDALANDLLPGRYMFSREEVLANLREFAASTEGRLTRLAYREWAQDRNGDPNRLQDRYVLSSLTVARVLGSWSEAVHMVGLMERASSPTTGCGPRGRSELYTKDEMVRWLREAAKDLGPRMTKAAYGAWAIARMQAARADGQHLIIPRQDSIARLFNGWASALHATGLISEAELRKRHGHRTCFRPDEELVEAVAEAVSVFGPDVGVLEFASYRRTRIREEDVHLPSDRLIRQRLGGSWGQAVKLAIELLRQRGVAVEDPSPGAHKRGHSRATSVREWRPTREAN